MKFLIPFALAMASLSCVSPSAPSAGDWTGQGGDAGMTKYSPDNIVARDLQLVYKKRFYSKWTDWTEHYGAYQYACNVMIRNGQAIVLTDDAPDKGGISGPLYYTHFNWLTGKTIHRAQITYGPAGASKSFHGGENPAEIDSNHFNFPAVWHSDGRVYARRGGDKRCQGALTVSTYTWTYLPSDKPIRTNGWGGDTLAFITAYRDNVIYHPGDLRDTHNYAVGDISAAQWAAGTPGETAYWAGGELVPYQDDMPKCGAGKLIVAYDASPFRTGGAPQTTVAATDLQTHKLAWKKSFSSQSGYQAQGPDKWQYVATEDGYFAMSYRGIPGTSCPGGSTSPATQPTSAGSIACTIYVLNSADGSERFTYKMGSAAERPLLAYARGFLYVIGKKEQVKLDIRDGRVIWRQTHVFLNDMNYAYNDFTYRPMVLTDDSLWFVDRSADNSSTNDRLIGIDTASGKIFQTLNVSKVVGQAKNEQLIHVQDLMAANGQLGVLVDIKETTDPHNITNGIKYQDLYVYRAAESAPQSQPAVTTHN